MLHVGTVYSDESADAILVAALLKQIAHAAQIARPFLADIGDEQDVGARANASGIHRAQPCQQHRERARVVTDTRREQLCALAADSEIGAGGEHSVEMRGDADQRAIADTWAHARDVALGIDLQVLQAVRFRHGEEGARAVLLIERWRGDLGQRDDVLDRAVMLRGQRGDGRAIGIAGHDLADNRLCMISHGICVPGCVRTVMAEVDAVGKRGETHMDLAERMQQELPPLSRWLGLTVTVAEPDRVVAELTVREELCTLGSIMHGGAIMAFADTVGAIGTMVNLREGQGTTTLESKTNFFAGSPVGTKLIAEATPLHRGRRTQVWETRISNEQGRLVAKVTQTQMILSDGK